MAVDYQYVWCVQFGEAYDYWLSSVGTFEPYGSSAFSCGRNWTVIKSTDFREILAAANAAQASVNSSFTVEEVAALKFQANNPSPFNLSFEDASLVSGLVLAVWAAAVGIRSIVGIFNRTEE